MKISGFTIIKNAVLNDYPIVEAIRSILPIVDEMIVLIGDCTDTTVELIESIQSDKIKIHHSIWDKSVRIGGQILAIETDKAFQLIDPQSSWAFYIQGDEVVHEKDYNTIRLACKEYETNNQVQGLLFKYIHFYGNYNYIGDSRKWYSHEVRIIKNNKNIKAYRDAQGFRLNGHKKIRVKKIAANIYHYGWVKEPSKMQTKINQVTPLWVDIDIKDIEKINPSYFDFENHFDSLVLFNGNHPMVMHDRIQNKNWDLALNLSKKKFKFKNRILYWFEKKFKIRLFEFKNYRIIK